MAVNEARAALIDRDHAPQSYGTTANNVSNGNNPAYVVNRNLWSYVTFSWIQPLLRTGKLRPLKEEDLPDFNAANSARSASGVMLPFWCKLADYHRATASGLPQQPPNFAWTLARHFMPRILLALVLDLLVVATSTLMPLLISEVIAVLDPTADHSRLRFSSAYEYAVAYFVMTLLSIICTYTRDAVLLDIKIKTRSILIGEVFRKTFRLTLGARASTSTGQINSFVDSDVTKIAELPNRLITVSTASLQIVLAIYFLARELGMSTWITAGVYVGMGFGTTWLTQFRMRAEESYMSFLDQRITLLRELIQSIRSLKMEAAEKVAARAINAVRDSQLHVLVSLLRWEAVVLLFLIIQQDAIPTIAITAFYIFGGKLTASSAFTVLAFLSALQDTSSDMENVSMEIAAAVPSIQRLSAFLIKPEETGKHITHRIKQDDAAAAAIRMDAATFSYNPPLGLGHGEAGSAQQFKLSELSLSLPRGSFVVCVGVVGSGKSTFLSSLVGSVSLVSGGATVNGSIAYCSQVPWIISGTIENNIKGFAGTASDRAVKKAVDATCLDQDLALLPQGLQTRIGERGITLSGGQKSRVALARAIASDPDIYILDEPLGALDAHVGRTILEQTLFKRLRGKTIVLATHQLHVACKADIVLVFENGRIVEQGSVFDLKATPSGIFASLVASLPDDTDDQAQEDQAQQDVALRSVEDDTLGALAAFETSQVVAEDRRVGVVKASVYKSYFKAAGSMVILPLVLFPLAVAADALAQISLVVWSSDGFGWSDGQYFALFGSLGLFRSVFALLTAASIFITCYRASTSYHKRALDGLVGAPVHWYDHQPVGRILNRMGADIEILDVEFPPRLEGLSANATGLGGSIIVLVFGSPYMLLLFAAMSVPAVLAFRYFQASYRELKRLSSLLQSPLSAHVSESLDGLATIMIYEWVDAFVARQEETVDLANKATLLLASAQSWVFFRLRLLSSLIILTTLLLAGAGFITANTTGLLLVASIAFPSLLNSTLFLLCNAEASFNAVERLDHYANLPKERAQGPSKVSYDWPTAGAISFEDVSIAYGNSAPVIKNLTLEIRAGEHIGLVGRTGAGKSTLAAALFRLMELSSGRIRIDGQDIADVDLGILRTRLMIIPQEPLVSTGSYRSNLDRDDSYAESAIWHALDVIGMKEYVSAHDLKLDAPVTGDSLSCGQRQLLVMAKALLRKDLRVLILDESTAAVDEEADSRIGALIKDHFKDTTVICVAHRLTTVAALDRVAVMSEGELVECGAPHELLTSAGPSLFADLVNCTGPSHAAVIREISAQNHLTTNRR
ncbi:Multidrug resistance-associated protein 1 [Geranomyces variabilis]|nr:Multidrug resistance-associated protein 1 [Geranomyces variabilis]